MDNLFKQCIKNHIGWQRFYEDFTKRNQKIKTIPDNDLCMYITYKQYSTSVVKRLFLLESFVAKEKIKTDQQLLAILNQNPVSNHNFIKTIKFFVAATHQSFVDSLKSIKIDGMAKMIQYTYYNDELKKQLTYIDPLFAPKLNLKIKKQKEAWNARN